MKPPRHCFGDPTDCAESLGGLVPVFRITPINDYTDLVVASLFYLMQGTYLLFLIDQSVAAASECVRWMRPR